MPEALTTDTNTNPGDNTKQFEVPFEQVHSELIDDFVGGGQPETTSPEPRPETSEPPAAPVAEPTPTPAERPAVAAPPTATPPPVSEPKKVKFRGREYTEAEANEAFQKDPEFRAAALTRGEQVHHFQSLYERTQEENDRMRQALEQLAATRAKEAQPQPDPAMTLEQMQHRFAPAVKEAVEKNLLSEEFANLYPKETTHFFLMQNELATIKARLDGIGQAYGGDRQQAFEQGLHRHVLGGIDSLIASDEFFKDLSEPENKQAFIDYIWKRNPELGQLTPEYFGDAYLGFRKTLILEDRRARAAEAQAHEDAQRRNLTGVGGSPRPGAIVESLSEHEEFIRD